MEKKWYAVYTKPQSEKKVAVSLGKKQIESFVPMVEVKSETLMGHKLVSEPLFKSIVFVYAQQEEIASLKQTSGVINLLFWLGKPAVIAREEIAVIREFTAKGYKNIKLEPAGVSYEQSERGAKNGSTFSIEGKLYTMKNKMVKINLPSLGFALIAEIDEESIFIKGLPFEQHNRFTYS